MFFFFFQSWNISYYTIKRVQILNITRNVEPRTGSSPRAINPDPTALFVQIKNIVFLFFFFFKFYFQRICVMSLNADGQTYNCRGSVNRDRFASTRRNTQKHFVQKSSVDACFKNRVCGIYRCKVGDTMARPVCIRINDENVENP